MNVFSAAFPISLQDNCDLAENIPKSHIVFYWFTLFWILGTEAVIDTIRRRYFLLYWNIFCNIILIGHKIFYWFLLFQILRGKSAIYTERQSYLLWYSNKFCSISEIFHLTIFIAAITQEWLPSSTYQQLLTLGWVPWQSSGTYLFLHT